MKTEKIIIGCDHGGLNLKNAVIAHLQAAGVSVEDVGRLLQLSGVRRPRVPQDTGRNVYAGYSDLRYRNRYVHGGKQARGDPCRRL